MDRRKFIKNTLIAAAGAVVAGSAVAIEKKTNLFG